MRVLLIDDNVVVRQTLKRGLELMTKDDIEVAEAGRASEALELVEGFLPDIVLVDVNLPDINGIECARRIKSLFPNTRVVGWSGEPAGGAEMLQAGADAFVLKGEPLNRLIETLTATERDEETSGGGRG